ncbi:MAG: sulfite exporter TauE/SafE family protein [Gammaproteobacteria bacterium]
MDLALTLSGFIVGFIIGLTGVGGGSLMTPILVLVFSVQPAVAVGTDLLYAAITKSGGIFAHHARKNINWQVVGLLSLGSVPATLISIGVIKWLHVQGIDYDHLITSILGVALLLTALAIIFKTHIIALGEKEQFAGIQAGRDRWAAPATVLAGAIIGGLVSFSSVGAGALGVAILFFLYPHMQAIRVVGTDLAHAVPVTAIAGIGHWHVGTVDFSLLLMLIIGSLPGIYLGSRVGTGLPEKYLRTILATVLLLIGGKLAIAAV